MLELLAASKKHTPPGIATDYTAYVNWVNAQSGLTTVSPTNSPALTGGWKRTDVTADSTSTMWGTPYKSIYTHDSATARILRHAVPNANIFSDIVAGKRTCLWYHDYLDIQPSYTGIARNGYTSANYTNFRGARCTSVVYWDYQLGSVMRYNPYADSAPVVFDFDLTKHS